MLDRERRLQPRCPTLAFAGLDERGLVTADVGTRTHLDPDVEAVPERAVVAQFGQLPFEIASQVCVFGPQVQDPVGRADGDAGDDHADEHLLGRTGQQHAILERSGLTLVGIADDVLIGPRRGPAQPPLVSGGEAGAAPAAQPRIGDGGDHLLGRGHQAPAREDAVVGLLGEEHRPAGVNGGVGQCVDVFHLVFGQAGRIGDLGR